MASWWQKLIGYTPKPAHSPEPASDSAGEPDERRPIDEEARADIAAFVATKVAAGYDTPEAIVIGATDVFGDEYTEGDLRLVAAELVLDAMEAHQADAAHWPAVTDYDRLDAAFSALEAEGVIARQDFTCCGTCGSYEIWDEIAAARDAGKPAHGYAFFHMQDTEGAVDGSGLFLSYGACEEGEAPALDVARTIVTQLEAQGLRTTWDGTIAMRIGVSLDWKRRRPAEMA